MKKNKLDSKKILVFIGANRKSNFNVSISCIEYLIKKFSYDKYTFVVTDNNKEIIKLLTKYKLDYLTKISINKIILSTKKDQYDWLLNLWGHKIFPSKFLAKFENNLNLHPSFLPYGKGKDSIVWSLFYNLPAGISIHKMTNKLDGGPIYTQKKIKYNFTTTGKELYENCLKVSIDEFVKNWPKIRLNKLKLKLQKNLYTKVFNRSKLLNNNLFDLDDKKNITILNFIKYSISQNFYPNFTMKIKKNNQFYNINLNLDKIKK